jgi:hypothetical protein
MATDSLIMLSPTQLIQNVARHLLSYNAYIIKQLPHALQARIKPTTFLSAFSINLDHQRISVGPWATAPTGYCQPSPCYESLQSKTRSLSFQNLVTFFIHSFIHS